MLEKIFVAVTLTFAVNVFLEHSWSTTTQPASEQQQQAVTQTVSQLPLENTLFNSKGSTNSRH